MQSREGSQSVPLWRKGWFQFILFFPLTLFLLWLAFRRVDLKSLLSILRETHVGWLLLGFLVSFVSYVVRALRWGVLLEPVGGDIRFGRLFYALMVGYFVNLLLPRAGEVVRCVELERVGELKTGESLGTVLSERLCDLLMFLLLTGIAVLVSVSRFGVFLRDVVFLPFWSAIRGDHMVWKIVLGGVVFCLLCWLLWRGVLGARVRTWLGSLWKSVLRGLKSILHLRRPSAFLFYTVLLWLLYWLMTGCICQAFPSTRILLWSSYLILLVVGTFGMLIPVQGGFGSYHLAVALWLQVEGLSYGEGLALATLSHGVQTVLMLIVPAVLYGVRVMNQWRRKAVLEEVVHGASK